MNQDLLERGATSIVTRRTIVKTGAKLAYAAPLVAASFKLSSMGALAAADGSCPCFDTSQSPKQGQSQSVPCGAQGTCYACKADDGHTICGQAKTGSPQVTCVGGVPTCTCHDGPDGCTVTDSAGVVHTYLEGEVISVCPTPAANSNCGGVGGPSPA